MTETTSLSETIRSARVIDLSQTLEEHIPNYPTHSKYFHNLWGSYWHGGRSLTYQLVMNEHNGTHVDAPAHFISDAKPRAHVTIEQVPLTRLMGRGVRLDCREFKEGDYVTETFVAEWEEEHGALKAGDIVLFNFGWSAHWGLRPDDKRYVLDWPGVSMGAAEYLIEKSVGALGVDTLSPDPPGALAKNPIHPVVLEKQVLIVENLTNLEQLPDFFLFLAMPLKIRGGSGSPIRAVAVV
ncbi:MAG TPA: cyclase family protein [Terriglobia bacterium]|nr:cyclase family protein [Terriglobia bacterium]